MNFAAFLAFSKLTADLGKVERALYVSGTTRRENDMEHSYHLSMMAWYLIDSNKLSLDLSKVLRYSLAHDLVEVYAGDTYFYSLDQELLASKDAREAEAAERLEKEFPEFPELHDALQAYVRRDSPESRFVYALDKIMPLLRNIEDGGRQWREKGVTLEMLIEKKTDKVALSPEVQPYYDELVALIRKEELMAKK
jgi:putative hydrolase of HD superfamily